MYFPNFADTTGRLGLIPAVGTGVVTGITWFMLALWIGARIPIGGPEVDTPRDDTCSVAKDVLGESVVHSS